MAISKEDVKHIARLARLNLSEKEFDYFAGQLDSIINYINQLKEIDTSGVEPTSHVLPIKNVFREDIVKQSLKSRDALKNVSRKENNLFKVPRVIKES